MSLFYKWVDYYKREPWGAKFDNWMMAVQAQQFALVHSKKGSSPKVEDYMYADPDIDKEEKLHGLIDFFEGHVKG